MDDQNVCHGNMHHKMPLLCVVCFFSHFFQSKRALSSIRQKKNTMRGASYDAYSKASITLEMVVVLPLFMCFMTFFLFLFRVLEVQECMEEALMFTSRTLAIECYGESEEKRKTDGELLVRAGMLLTAELKESACPMGFIRGGRAGISLLSSDFSGDDIVLCVSYEMRLPIRLTGSYAYRFRQCAQSRKWIGDITLKSGSEREDELWVYITPRGSVYHLTRECPYLDLSIRAVGKSSVGRLRNASGGIYKACESCGRKAGGTVYVTDYGDRYHGCLSCGGLKRTIYMVKISETGGRHVCSKCGNRQQ